MALITRTRLPEAVSTSAVPRPGQPLGPVHGAQKIGIALDKDQRLALVEGVIAERHHVGARRKKPQENILGDAETMRGVFAVHHDEIGRIALAEDRQVAGDGVAARAAHHIAEENQAQRYVSCSVIMKSSGASYSPRGTRSTICA